MLLACLLVGSFIWGHSQIQSETLSRKKKKVTGPARWLGMEVPNVKPDTLSLISRNHVLKGES